MKIKKGDNIMVIAGKENGKRGPVEKVFPKLEKVLITGTNLSKHHLKPSRKSPHGGIIDKPTPINISNVILICPRCGKPTRVGYKTAVDTTDKTKTKKMRICKKCNESVD